jgi:hypothetical protein
MVWYQVGRGMEKAMSDIDGLSDIDVGGLTVGGPTVRDFSATMSKLWYKINRGDDSPLLTINKISTLPIVRKWRDVCPDWT